MIEDEEIKNEEQFDKIEDIQQPDIQLYDKYSDDEDSDGDNIGFEGLEMPIQDDEYEEEDRMKDNNFGPIRDDKEPDFSKMINNGKDLTHLKLAGAKKGGNKEIDIRKGINIERNVKMNIDAGGGVQPKQEFDIIQHSQSNFEGVKGALVKSKQDAKGSRFNNKQGAAALQSFANAGGTSHIPGL